VNVDFTTCRSCITNELDGVVEDTSDVFLDMVLQVVTLVDDSLVLVVIVTVVSCAVDHVSNALVGENFSIFGHQVTSEVEEVVDDLGANALVVFVFVFFARGATIVKVFVIQLLWRNLKIFDCGSVSSEV
jgi:hypothetical protein